MRELGEYLRQIRQSKGIPLEEVALNTRINIGYLRALEDGNFDALPAEVYVIGFLKSYAEFMGIDPKELIERYEAQKPQKKRRWIHKQPASVPSQSAATAPSATTTTQSAEKTISIAEYRKYLLNLLHTIKAIPPSVYVVIILAAIVVLAIFSSRKSSQKPMSVTETVMSDADLGPAKTFPSDENISQEIRIPLDTINPAVALARAESLTLDVDVKQDAFVYVEVDYSRKVFEGKLVKGNKMRWRAKNAFYCTISDSRNVKAWLNGFDIALERLNFPRVLDINRQNALSFLEVYKEIIPDVSSFGQRREAYDSLRILKQPPTERIVISPRKTQQKQDTTQQNQPRIKPPKTRQATNQIQGGE